MNRLTLAFATLTLGLSISACSSKSKTADAQATDAKAAATTETKAAPANADKTKAAATSTAGKVLCETSSDKRLIEVRTKDAGCELAYTKFGKEEVIANSAAGSAHCQKISERIQSNLTEAGFKCAAN